MKRNGHTQMLFAFLIAKQETVERDNKSMVVHTFCMDDLVD